MLIGFMGGSNARRAARLTSATTPPGAWTSYGPALREPVGALHWAGAGTARTHFGLLEGALEAGERAADEVRSALDDQQTTRTTRD